MFNSGIDENGAPQIMFDITLVGTTTGKVAWMPKSRYVLLLLHVLLCFCVFKIYQAVMTWFLCWVCTIVDLWVSCRNSSSSKTCLMCDLDLCNTIAALFCNMMASTGRIRCFGDPPANSLPFGAAAGCRKRQSHWIRAGKWGVHMLVILPMACYYFQWIRTIRMQTCNIYFVVN